MFWKFDLHPSSAIDTMLTKEVSWVEFCMHAFNTAYSTQLNIFRAFLNYFLLISIWNFVSQDCTLGEILDEDDVLQETKSQNRKLVDL